MLRPRSRPRRRQLRLAVLCWLVAAAAATSLAVTFPNGASATAARGSAIAAADFDLGVRRTLQPLTGRFQRMPIRLQGTVAVPASAGPHPVVVIAHGAHGDNCPIVDGEFDTWPCWAIERRNDLGFRYLVRALAQAGIAAVAVDVNAAYTGGWGEYAEKEEVRFRQVVAATVAELDRADTGGGSRFGVPLVGRPDLTRLGLLGHSRGGMNVVRYAGARTPTSIFLLAPFFDAAQRLPDVPTTVLLGTCDGDTGLTGAGYVAAAAKRKRTSPVVQVTLARANHNFYNQTLVAAKLDDAAGGKGPCADGARLSGQQQQAFLRRVAVDHFVSALLGKPAPAWATTPGTRSIYGQRVTVRRVG